MKKKIFSLLILGVMVVFASCSSNPSSTSTKNNKKLQVVATNSVIGDMVQNVAGDKIDFHNIVPVGQDPHEYEPLPKDVEKCSEADIIFYNGLNLETGGNSWFSKLMNTAHKKEEKDYFAVSRGVQAIYLTGKGQSDKEDPHAWLDISNGIIYVKNIEKTLSEKDPENKDTYEKNAKDYIEKLSNLDEKAKREFKDIPESKRTVVTSEGCFKYFSKAYGCTAAYIWEINTDEEGTPDQIKGLVDKLRSSKVPALFVETSVDKRPMETISKETKIPIYATIFTDSIGNKGENGDSYYSMMEWNLNKIHEGLSK